MEQPTNTSLADRLDKDFAPAWRPKPDEKLIGTILEISVRETEFGRYPILTILTDDGEELAFHALHTVAKNELAKLRPNVGDRLGIKYRGKAEAGYHNYRIKKEDTASTPGPDWDAIGEQARQEAEDQRITADFAPAAEASDNPDDIPF